jgi:hypothetical protein
MFSAVLSTLYIVYYCIHEVVSVQTRELDPCICIRDTAVYCVVHSTSYCLTKARALMKYDGIRRYTKLYYVWHADITIIKILQFKTARFLFRLLLLVV